MAHACSWLSLGFEDLLPSISDDPRPIDILVVGSGYGGALAAATFAGARDAQGRTLRVCVLERGREYLPGSFPTRVDDLAGHVRLGDPQSWIPRGRAEGLFDVRAGNEVSVVVANGLGGGSLINAGVMLKPTDAVLDRGFPEEIGGARGLDAYFQRAGAMLGLREYTADSALPKAKALAALSGERHRYVPITVALEESPASSAGVELRRCLECGDCATGCNFGAKDSLDVNLLVTAADKGAEIYTGATVLALERDKEGTWAVEAVHTDNTLRARQAKPAIVHAHRVVLAAGALGSTEILLRSRRRLTFSQKLGGGFSTNGDMIATVYGHKAEANAVADEAVHPEARRGVGPTITSMLDFRTDRDNPFVIQEMAVPGPLRRLFEELFTTANTLHELVRPDHSTHRHEPEAMDPCAVNPEVIRRSSVLAIMGDDGAGGELRLAPQPGAGLAIRWPKLRHGSRESAGDSVFDQQVAFLEKLVANGAGGNVLPNPAWRMVPPTMAALMDGMRGPPLTVHPLGGCRMASDVKAGVVNHRGEVFDGASDEGAVHPGLVVLDGAIIPKALGINPAFTISALALRACEALLEEWKLTPADAPPARGPRQRPTFKVPEYGRLEEPQFTFVERLRGPVANPAGLGKGEHPMVVLEITLKFQAAPLSRLMGRMHRALVVDAERSRVRVFSPAGYEEARKWVRGAPDLEARLDKQAIAAGALRGEMRFFHREPSFGPWRGVRGIAAFLRNRGLRDWLAHRLGRGRKARDAGATTAKASWKELWAVATRAAEVRRFDYALVASIDGHDVPIHGHKRLTYGMLANLWEQLEDLEITTFGEPTSGFLQIDLPYFAAENVQTPLMRIETQPNLARSLIELASFAAYLFRVVVGIHLWSFRRPDAPRSRELKRLPQGILRPHLPADCGLALPRLHEIDMGVDRTVHVRLPLVNYHQGAPDPNRTPVLLIHGYSASGTTFAHEALRPGLAEWLWSHGHDVWVGELRTSSGLKTGALGWDFEDVATKDIPAMVARIRAETGAERIDVVAHCMGAAMFSMAVLDHRDLHTRIRRVVLSQVGPRIEFSPVNVARAYVMRYVRHYLGISRYDFRVESKPSLLAQLLDRLASTLRYPMHERRIEHSLDPRVATEYLGTRHRMDALYGRTFSLANMGTDVLDRIDDFFGSLSMDTLAQALHMARLNVITDWRGRNVYLNRRSRDEKWLFETMTLHATDNGLVSHGTRDRIDRYFNRDDADKDERTKRIKLEDCDGVGHQDSLIGTPAVTLPVFRKIGEFLAEGYEQEPVIAGAKWFVRRPFIGPILGVPNRDGDFPIAGAANPAHGDAAIGIVVPVRRRMVGEHEHFELVTVPGQPATTNYVVNCDSEGWFSLVIPKAVRYAAHEGLLVLVAYHQPEASGDGGGGVMMVRADLDMPTPPREEVERLVQRAADEEGDEEQGALRLFNAEQSRLPRAARRWRQAAPPVRPKRTEFDAALEKRVADLLGKWPATSFDAAFIPTPRAIDDNAAARIFLASCQYPHGILDRHPAWAGYARLDKVLREDGRDNTDGNSLLVLTGDQIYSDATAGLFDPTGADDRYQVPYQALFSQAEVASVLRQVPSVMMLDDHEILENWEPGMKDTGHTRGRVPEGPADGTHGKRAYCDFQRRAGPRPPPRQPGEVPTQLWFQTQVGSAPVFVADTRTQRDPRTPETLAQARIMSKEQHEELEAWLLAVHEDKHTRAAPKFIVSPAIMFPRRLGVRRRIGRGARAGTWTQAGAIRSDAWDGFPYSMGRLLHVIVAAQIEHVVFLSGDEHLFCLASADLVQVRSGLRRRVHSVHGSPLYAPFPFANAEPPDFGPSDVFCFKAPQDGTLYRCTVKTIFKRCNGFAEIVCTLRDGAWDARVGFHDANCREEGGGVEWLPLIDPNGGMETGAFAAPLIDGTAVEAAPPCPADATP